MSRLTTTKVASKDRAAPFSLHHQKQLRHFSRTNPKIPRLPVIREFY